MTTWLGIDVSKATLEVAADDDACWQVPKTPAGWQAIVARGGNAPPTGVVMEATGDLAGGPPAAADGGGCRESGAAGPDRPE